MSDQDLIRHATEHLDLSKNHEAGLIPTATSLLIRDLIAEIVAIRAEGFAAGWAAAIEAAAGALHNAANDWRSTGNELPARKIEDEIPGVRDITPPSDARAALDRMLREARGRAMVEAAEIIARAEEIEKEARNG